jgi:membrane protease YdiL (CAAX protease family)
MKGSLKNSNFAGRFFQFWLVFLFCFAGGAIIGAVLTGGDFDNIFSLKMRILIQSSASFLVPSFVLAYLWSEKPLRFLGFRKKSYWKTYFFVFWLMLAAIPFINLLADLNARISFPESLSGIEMYLKAMESRAAMQTERILTVYTLGGLLFNIFIIAIIPALGEELFFRGTLQRIFSDARGAVFAIWISAFIFSAFHFQFYGFIPRMLLGAFFGYLFVWSRDIWLPIVAHFANNFFIILYFYFYKNNLISADLKTIGTGETWWLGAICGIVFIFGIFLCKNLCNPKKIKILS